MPRELRITNDRNVPHSFKSTVLVPNRQAARSLQIPHRTLGHLAMKILRQQELAVAPLLHAHRTLVASVEAMMETRDASGAARAMLPTISELLRTGTDLDALERHGSPKTRALARVTNDYVARLAADGFVDQAAVMWRASENVTHRQRVTVHGYPRLGSAEVALIDALAGDGSVVTLPSGGHAMFQENNAVASVFEARGWNIVRDDAHPASMGHRLSEAFLGNTEPSDVSAFEYSDMHAEVRGVLATVKQLLSDAVPAREIVIVARDEAAYGPALLAAAWEYDVPIRALYDTPLLETRFGNWVATLMQAIQENLPYEVVAKLLAHPLSNALPPEQWKQARKLHPEGLGAWEGITDCVQAFAWPANATAADYVDHLQQTVNAFDVRRRATHWPREIIAYHTLTEELATLRSSEHISSQEFFTDLRDLLQLLQVPAHPGRGGVELHSPLSIVGATYRHLLVLGAAEGMLPSPTTDNAILDYFERNELRRQGIQIETAAEAARREEIGFWELLRTTAGNVIFTYPKLMDNREVIPSAYLERLQITPQSAPVHPICSSEEHRRAHLDADAGPDAVLDEARSAWRVEMRRESSEPHDEFDGVTGTPVELGSHTFSATQLMQLGQCPYKWFGGYLLGLQEPEEAEDDLSYTLRGSLYHHTLEIALRKAQDASDLRAAVVQVLDESMREAEEALGIPTPAGWEAERREHLTNLRHAVEAPEFIAENANVKWLEKNFETTWRGLNVRGKLDRVDELPGAHDLVDYKTSSSAPPGAKDASGRTQLDLQLPIYREAGLSKLEPDADTVTARYYSLTKAKDLRAREPDDATLDEFVKNIKERFGAGAFPVDPDIEHTACKYCHFDLLCRRGPRLARKRNA